jgi:DNA-binding NarL/FixJ family response regulator
VKTTRTVRVVIADDHRLMLEALQAALAVAERIQVVATTHKSTEVITLVARHTPDLVLLDVLMPELDGWTCLDRINRRYPDVKVVLVSALSEDELVEPARKRGAAAVASKSAHPTDLAGLIRRVAAGEGFEVCGFGSPSPEDDLGLSPREVSVLRALAPGRSNREIADALVIGENTVRFHLSNIYEKLNVSGRTAAVRLAHERGLVPTL